MPYEETENGNEIFTCSTCGYTVMIQGTGADIDCPQCIQKEYESESEVVLTGSQVKNIMEQFATGKYQMDGVKKLKQFIHEIETDLCDSQESDEYDEGTDPAPKENSRRSNPGVLGKGPVKTPSI